ncbi:hypothetical protein FGO68_gene10450 [Halteria grandinella]|uniref:Uncharacterized protein n=1 Tax=Halteria grandinella TaxID=5974 RepID=A0A8J8NST2_HALGN|nr:hypothetical protein FGO68_gene10450 [Halteria grandinella]
MPRNVLNLISKFRLTCKNEQCEAICDAGHELRRHEINCEKCPNFHLRNWNTSVLQSLPQLIRTEGIALNLQGIDCQIMKIIETTKILFIGMDTVKTQRMMLASTYLIAIIYSRWYG